MFAIESSAPHVSWRCAGTDLDAVVYDIDWKPDGIVASLTARRDVVIHAAVQIHSDLGFAVAMFDDGTLQRVSGTEYWAGSERPLRRWYAMSRDTSLLVVPAPATRAVARWCDEGTAVWLVAAGETPRGVRRGGLDQGALRPELLRGGETRILRCALLPGEGPVIDPAPDGVHLPTGLDRRAHALGLWGTTVPSLGSLEISGSAYPAINLPERTYGTLHTFFDPDAWSTCAALSFSGVPELVAQARAIIERSLSHVTDDGLAPHHFDDHTPTYVAMSGSPQPGPNLFLAEAAIDHCCATGDVEWFASAWRRGLRRVCAWVLSRLDKERGLLHVVGALWVDVFHRAGYTLDANAMAVRTLARAAQAAALVDDPIADDLAAASASIRDGLQALWRDDHFITSLDADGGEDDHVDTENYLAVAVGAATPEQSKRIVALFDSAELTHPGGRGTWVSLRRYEADECYLANTGDSDVAMARHLWADLMARRRIADRDGFFRLFDAVRGDLMRSVWMRERYGRDGEQVRAPGYHEYPEVLGIALREGVYGLVIDPLRVDIAPMARAGFDVRFGAASLSYHMDRVSLRLPGSQPRTVRVHGLPANAGYTWRGGRVSADDAGTVDVDVVPDGAFLDLELRLCG